MKDISIYFKPVSNSLFENKGELFHSIQIHNESGFPEVKDKGVAILYTPEYRNSAAAVEGQNEAFREQLYSMSIGDAWNFTIYDLGTIVPGETQSDTIFALSQVVSELVKNDILPFVIGGSQDLTLACYKGFEAQEQMINICSVDNTLDVGDPNQAVTSNGFISHLLMQRPCYLFNYTTLGIQRPFTNKKDVDLFDKLYFDMCRLGELNNDFKVSEPFLRNSDLLTIDFKSIKSSDSDVSVYLNPNGVSAQQVCQISKYAGISDKMSCVGVFDIDLHQSSMASGLLAQIIWYFLDGYSSRVGDFPIGSKKNYTKFYVHLDDFDDDLVFYKSDKSNRWWLEVRYNPDVDSKYDRHQMVPCDKKDYDNALSNQIPDLWWKTLKKIN